MSNSYRIRTQVGVDKSLKVLLEQDFEYLEVLSLKLTQSQIYSRPCSDYGVVIGRVSVNGGYGVPNCKVSVFIPLTTEDETNPIISDLYPYKTLSDLNEDGYRYNLLPYEQSYSNHSPTGTFFTRMDVLTNPTLIEVFDKYYKYTARTNDSGDFMIFGVPVGSQTIHMDVDLSDIGEFSLSPQDLIRMGMATENQVSGSKFRSSSNFSQLPQIISINKVIEVEPLWGQPEVCNLGITRTDFDLSTEANIVIQPTAIFMGSIVSSNEDQYQKRNCKPSLKLGNLCGLVTGPGEILAIRQTIQNDASGRPILETVDLEQNGQVIDENGTWLVDVPMNLDRVITNEFGEQVLSNDPTVGIPTTAKYRFKVKWNQQPTLSEPIKRGYFLVPNIREYGWVATNSDPLQGGAGSYSQALASYAFSLDWNDYANPQDAINCVDTFYPMYFNKVYTVSQLIDQYKNGTARNRIIAIKDMLDSECESENNKFPTNDANLRFDILYILFVLFLNLFKPILYNLLIVVHVLAFFLRIIGPLLGIIVLIGTIIAGVICFTFNYIISAVNTVLFSDISKFDCPDIKDAAKNADDAANLWKYFTNIQLPNLSYPSCETCQCTDGQKVTYDTKQLEASGVIIESTSSEGKVLIQSKTGNKYTIKPKNLPYKDSIIVESLITPGKKSLNSIGENLFTSSLTLPERINLFNTKSKYFNGPLSYVGKPNISNPGGGVNIIKVRVEPKLNVPKIFHYDNVIALVCDEKNGLSFSGGGIYSFQDPEKSGDNNINLKNLNIVGNNQYGSKSITGTSINSGTTSNPATITLTYANPNGSGSNIPVSYKVIQKGDDANYARYPIDIEYFQCITAMTYSDFISKTNKTATSWSVDGFNERFLNSDSYFSVLAPNLSWTTSQPNTFSLKPIQQYNSYIKQRIVFFVRGVDPNSTRMNIEYDLSVLFGYDMGNGPKVSGSNYKLNHPIKGGFKAVSHGGKVNTSTNIDTYSNSFLYYDSFHFKPDNSGTPFSFHKFSSNLPRYYSSLSGKLPLSFQPNTSSPSLSTFATGTTNGIEVTQNNGLTKEWRDFRKSTLGDFYAPALNDYSTRFNDRVNTIAIDTVNKRFIIGGNFTLYNGENVNKIVGLKYTGEIDETFDVGTGFTTNGEVYSIEVDNSGIYVGGNFTQYYSGVNCNNIVKLQSNGLPDQNFTTFIGTGFNNIVRTITSDNSNGIYVGGDFTSFNGSSANRIIKLNSSGGVIGAFVYGSGFDNGVYTIERATNGDIFVGGNFTTYKGSGSNRIIRINNIGTKTGPIPSGTGFNDIVRTIKEDSSGNIYVGGDFTTYNSVSANRIVKLLSTGQIDVTFNYGNGFNNSVYSILLISNTILIGGEFTTYDTATPIRQKIIKLFTNGLIDTSFFIGTGFLTNGVKTLKLDNTTTPNRILVGGEFLSYYGNSFERIVRINLNGTPDYNFKPKAFNRGYYPNERLDGGSLLALQVNGLTQPVTNGYLNFKTFLYSYSPIYTGGYLMNYNSLGTSGCQIVMRSDRLPTSQNETIVDNNSFSLQNNENFTAWLVPDEGLGYVAGGEKSNTAPQIGNFGDVTKNDIPNFTNKVLDSFECPGMVPLGCYSSSGGQISIKPQGDSCYSIFNEQIVEKGCYRLVTTVLVSLFFDIGYLTEWASRMSITFAACRNTWNHMFTNNWINGTLFAFSFKNDRFFTGPTDVPPNSPFSSYCKDTILLHPTTRNFYYRSSPYNSTIGQFIGRDRPSGSDGNSKNLMFPTTIMDLGPRSNYLQEIVMTDNYDGYVINKIPSTTYGDVSEILNLFIISRLVNTSFLSQLLGVGGASVINYFDQRNNLFVDGDYAQMISINSELGVSPFESINYPDPLPPAPASIYYNGAGTADGVIGIFFSSDTQVRDFITPKRTIINDNVSLPSTCAFNYFSVFSQSVPFYQWDIIKNTDNDSIFGSQKNTWATEQISGGFFFQYKYQSMDRINQQSRYMRPKNSVVKYYKGYIYSVNSSGVISPNINDISLNTPLNSGGNVTSKYFTVGAPFHFYFGLKKGKSAWDRFAIKWMDFQKISD